MESLVRFSFWKQILIALLFYVVCSSIGLFISSDGIAKLAVQEGKEFQYWDAIHYVNLGFHPRCQAFYPLWSQINRLFSPENPFIGLRYAFVICNVLFVLSLPIVLYVLKKVIKSETISFIILILYVINPNSIFHSIGYTESLFSLCAILSVVALLFSHSLFWNCILAVSVILMSVSRPSLVQLLFASFSALFCVFLGSHLQSNTNSQIREWKKYTIPTGLIAICSIVGYLIYGVYCLLSTGNFLTPFKAQVEWGRTLQLRPLFLLFPRSLLNDLHGLYFPFIILLLVLILIYFHTKRKKILLYIPKHPLLWITLFYPPIAILIYSIRSWQLGKAGKLTSQSVNPTIAQLQTNYVFFFCLFICIANATIGFLAASGYLYSLARFVFATPFFFIAFGMLIDHLDSPKTRQFLYGCILVSGLGLIEQWYRWGNNRWVG
ncbi:MAG: mannosyltransferase family protein [Nostoc sp. ChiSLP02]|nr:mannosyltransferase family protein [Nostoc sp. DedSLP05]MDZ8101108.1 mannosyltransferase family protein [Nostoc sp. DedSLP01]MDZ8187886.1 mannosyltransferase family protein [Nostoc sp. ChiSLP02]